MRIMMERMAVENLARTPPDILINARQQPVKLTDFWAERYCGKVAARDTKAELQAAQDRLPTPSRLLKHAAKYPRYPRQKCPEKQMSGHF